MKKSVRQMFVDIGLFSAVAVFGVLMMHFGQPDEPSGSPILSGVADDPSGRTVLTGVPDEPESELMMLAGLPDEPEVGSPKIAGVPH